MRTRHLPCLGLLVIGTQLLPGVFAGVAYDESISGDFSNAGLTPTVVPLLPGSNIIKGTTGRITKVDRDYFTVNVPAGFGLSAVKELAGTTVGGAVSFIGLEAGSKLTLPTNPPDATGLLGWAHYAPTATDVDLLPAMAVPADNSTGFTLPLGPGNYTFWIQDFGAGTFNYSFDLQMLALNPLVNLSGRSFVGTGDKILIAGFVITGAQPKTVLVRVSGPALSAFGVSGALADPTLQIADSHGATVASNTGWSSAANAAAIKTAVGAVGAFPWSDGSADSAILVTLQPGAYTALVWGSSGDSGNALVEVYDADPTPTGKIVNFSVRSMVGTGDSVQIAGFVIGGTQPKTVLVRSGGPALAPFGVSGVLSDPQITLYDSQHTVIGSNSGWSTATDAATIKATTTSLGAFAYADGSADSAILISLEPGAYTAVVSGASGDTGVALLEVCAVDAP